MVSELTEDLEKAGEYGESALEGLGGNRVNLSDFVNVLNSYEIAADPEGERYIVQDDEHQYSIQITNVHVEAVEEGSDELIANVFADESQTGFSNKAVSRYNVLSDQEIEVDSRDGATYDDGSDFLKNSADRAPDRVKQEMEKSDQDILEPETETGWGVPDNL